MKKRVLTVLNTLVEISLYLILLPIMLNQVIEYTTEINVPVILMSVFIGILLYTSEITRLIERKERKERMEKLLNMREEALRNQTTLYLIELFNKEIEERELNLEDYEEAFSTINLVTSIKDKEEEEEKQKEIRERLIQFILKERKRK